MRKIFFLLLLPALSFSQKWYKPLVTGNDAIIYSAEFVAGAADGLHEVINNHIHTFERVWPNAHMHWWNPKLSQDNKKHTLTIISDGYHVTRLIDHTMTYFSIAIAVSDMPKKNKVLYIGKRMLLSILSNRLAFHIVYNNIFNDSKEHE